MTLSTLRPNGTTNDTGVLTGAANAHTAMSDDSDASFDTFSGTPNSGATVTLTDLTLPAGAVIKLVSVRVRVGSSSSGALLARATSTGAPSTSGTVNVGTGPATLQVGASVTGWTDPQLDAASLVLAWQSGGNVRVFEAYLDVRYVVLPVVTVTAPTGTVTTTNVPVTAWSNALDTDGGPQSAFQVKIFNAAQYGAGGFSPDTSTPTANSDLANPGGSQTSWASNIILSNATYRAYVRTAQTVNGVYLWSAWAFSGFIINVALPAVPTVALTAQATNGRISVLVTPNSGAATTDRLELQRSVDGGTTWLPVRNIYGSDGLVLQSTAATILDYEAPNGTATQYRARAAHNYSGEYASSAWSTPVSTTWTATDWWIKHPNVPALNLKLTQSMFSYGDVNRAARQTPFQPLGATLPIVVSDTRGGPTGTLVLQLQTVALRTSLNALLDTVSTLLLQGPAAEGQPDRYVRFGDHGSVRAVDKSWALTTRETLPWTEVASPAGAQT